MAVPTYFDLLATNNSTVATQNQYKFFHDLYSEELNRLHLLESRGKLLLSISTLFVASSGFLQKYSEWPTRLTAIVDILSVLLFTMATFFIILALRIRNFQALADPEEIINNFGELEMSDSEFFDHRLIDCAIATNINAILLNKVGRWLEIAGYTIALAISLQLIKLTLVAEAAFNNG